MKGLFIPDITAEMFRNGCLESIEALMEEGEVYDIEYDPKSEEHRQLEEWLKELIKFKSLKCKTCNEYDVEENWCYRHGVDRSHDDFCSDWED